MQSRKSMFAVVLGALVVCGSAASAQSGRVEPRRGAEQSQQVQKHEQRTREMKQQRERTRTFRNDHAMKAPGQLQRAERERSARPMLRGDQQNHGERGKALQRDRTERFSAPRSAQPGRSGERNPGSEPRFAKKQQHRFNKFDVNGNGVLEPAEMKAFNTAKRERKLEHGRAPFRQDGGAGRGAGKAAPFKDRAMRGGDQPRRDATRPGQGGFGERRPGKPMFEGGRSMRGQAGPRAGAPQAGKIPQDVRERIMKNHDTDGDGKLSELERRRIREMVEQGRREQQRGPAPAPMKHGRDRRGDAI